MCFNILVVPFGKLHFSGMEKSKNTIAWDWTSPWSYTVHIARMGFHRTTVIREVYNVFGNLESTYVYPYFSMG